MKARRLAVLLASTGLLAGCSGGPSDAAVQSEAVESAPVPTWSPPPTTGAEMLAWLELPVDPELAPVSISDLSPEASEVLDACWITDTRHELIGAIGFETVAGMAVVSQAKDLPKYLPLINDPNINVTTPAWAIRLAGEHTLPHFEVRDPTCVVIGGAPSWLDTGASVINGVWEEAPRPADPPPFRLPPLQP